MNSLTFYRNYMTEKDIPKLDLTGFEPQRNTNTPAGVDPFASPPRNEFIREDDGPKEWITLPGTSTTEAPKRKPDASIDLGGVTVNLFRTQKGNLRGVDVEIAFNETRKGLPADLFGKDLVSGRTVDLPYKEALSIGRDDETAMLEIARTRDSARELARKVVNHLKLTNYQTEDYTAKTDWLKVDEDDAAMREPKKLTMLSRSPSISADTVLGNIGKELKRFRERSVDEYVGGFRGALEEMNKRRGSAEPQI